MNFKKIVTLGLVVVLFLIKGLAPFFLLLISAGLMVLSFWLIRDFLVFAVISFLFLTFFFLGLLILWIKNIEIDFLIFSVWFIFISTILLITSFGVSQFLGG